MAKCDAKIGPNGSNGWEGSRNHLVDVSLFCSIKSVFRSGKACYFDRSCPSDLHTYIFPYMPLFPLSNCLVVDSDDPCGAAMVNLVHLSSTGPMSHISALISTNRSGPFCSSSQQLGFTQSCTTSTRNNLENRQF